MDSFAEEETVEDELNHVQEAEQELPFPLQNLIMELKASLGLI